MLLALEHSERVQGHRPRVRECGHEVGLCAAVREGTPAYTRATDDARKLQGALDFCGIPAVPRVTDHRAAWPNQTAHARHHRRRRARPKERRRHARRRDSWRAQSRHPRREPPPSRGETERI